MQDLWTLKLQRIRRRSHTEAQHSTASTSCAEVRSQRRSGCHSRGLTYLNNRYYDPTLGNFTSVDPLVGRTGTPYLYANGSPATLADPSGLCVHHDGNHVYDDGAGPCSLRAQVDNWARSQIRDPDARDGVWTYDEMKSSKRTQTYTAWSIDKNGQTRDRRDVDGPDFYGLERAFDPDVSSCRENSQCGGVSVTFTGEITLSNPSSRDPVPDVPTWLTITGDGATIVGAAATAAKATAVGVATLVVGVPIALWDIIDTISPDIETVDVRYTFMVTTYDLAGNPVSSGTRYLSDTMDRDAKLAISGPSTQMFLGNRVPQRNLR